MGTVNQGNGFKLPVLGEEDIEAQLKAFEQEEAAKLGLKSEAHPTHHWIDEMVSFQSWLRRLWTSRTNEAQRSAEKRAWQAPGSATASTTRQVSTRRGTARHSSTVCSMTIRPRARGIRW